MISSLVKFEHKIGDKVYHLFCDHDSPIVEIKDALSQFMGHCVNVENQIKAQQEQAASEPAPVEAPVATEQPVEA